MLNAVFQLLYNVPGAFVVCVLIVVIGECYGISVIAFKKNLSNEKAKCISQILSNHKIRLSNRTSRQSSDN